MVNLPEATGPGPGPEPGPEPGGTYMFWIPLRSTEQPELRGKAENSLFPLFVLLEDEEVWSATSSWSVS